MRRLLAEFKSILIEKKIMTSDFTLRVRRKKKRRPGESPTRRRSRRMVGRASRSECVGVFVRMVTWGEPASGARADRLVDVVTVAVVLDRVSWPCRRRLWSP